MLLLCWKRINFQFTFYSSQKIDCQVEGKENIILLPQIPNIHLHRIKKTKILLVGCDRVQVSSTKGTNLKWHKISWRKKKQQQRTAQTFDWYVFRIPGTTYKKYRGVKTKWLQIIDCTILVLSSSLSLSSLFFLS